MSNNNNDNPNVSDIFHVTNNGKFAIPYNTAPSATTT